MSTKLSITLVDVAKLKIPDYFFFKPSKIRWNRKTHLSLVFLVKVQVLTIQSTAIETQYEPQRIRFPSRKLDKLKSINLYNWRAIKSHTRCSNYSFLKNPISGFRSEVGGPADWIDANDYRETAVPPQNSVKTR